MGVVHCWSHLRRRFVKLVRNTKSPIAEAAVRQIATLYAVEATVRGTSPQVRLNAALNLEQHVDATHCLDFLRPWLQQAASRIGAGFLWAL